MASLDLITIGRSSVDLYGAQVGGRLEDMASFNKYIGGSPTNIAAGTARLGLKSALITRVGDEHMGRFIREAHQQGLRCVRVVHGKGLGSPGRTPVLKNRVLRWLVQKSEVMAFVQARPAEGGAGALVVLLRSG